MVAHPTGRRFRALQSAFWRNNPNGTPCWICGQPIDQTISNPRHPLARSIDHVYPLAHGGPALDVALWRPAHYRCNSKRGAGRAVVKANTSREW